jgi:uncharacterized protein (TIGR02001 family)
MKIRNIFIFLFMALSNYTYAFSVTTNLSSLLGSRFAATTVPVNSLPVNTKQLPSEPLFPLPEGVRVTPRILSASLTTLITATISSVITPEFITLIKAKLLPESPPPVPIATFEPVGPPENISTDVESALPVEVLENKQISKKKQDDELLKKILSFQRRAFQGTFDITSLYVFRGISKSANSSAFQGGFTYTFLSSGIYLKVWGSNVDFLSRQAQQATVEADTIAGIKNKIGENFIYDLNMVRYNYPKAPGANYNEFVSFLRYKILTFNLGYSPNAFNAHENGLYYNGGLDIPIPERFAFQYANVSLFTHYGHYSLSERSEIKSYNDFLIGLQKITHPYTMQLMWKGTNQESGQKGLDANRLVGTLFIEF